MKPERGMIVGVACQGKLLSLPDRRKHLKGRRPPRDAPAASRPAGDSAATQRMQQAKLALLARFSHQVARRSA